MNRRAFVRSPEYMLQRMQKDIARWKKVIELQKITPQ